MWRLGQDGARTSGHSSPFTWTGLEWTTRENSNGSRLEVCVRESGTCSPWDNVWISGCVCFITCLRLILCLSLSFLLLFDVVHSCCFGRSFFSLFPFPLASSPEVLSVFSLSLSRPLSFCGSSWQIDCYFVLQNSIHYCCTSCCQS